jgi:uncharacterized protein YdhG (YjbR/CyaY superfamily)
MTSRAASVPAYIAEVPEDRRAVMKKLRSLCRLHLKGYQECMDYGLPAYKRNGVLEISFASQKNYVALYVMRKNVLDEFRAKITGASIGKGCIRFTKPERIPFDVLEELLRRNAGSRSEAC